LPSQTVLDLVEGRLKALCIDRTSDNGPPEELNLVAFDGAFELDRSRGVDHKMWRLQISSARPEQQTVLSTK
jgi:hypothetical protein